MIERENNAVYNELARRFSKIEKRQKMKAKQWVKDLLLLNFALKRVAIALYKAKLPIMT